MTYDFVFVVVLYNKVITDSATIKSLLDNQNKQYNSKIIVWNNGTLCCDIHLLECNIELIDNRKNESLAKIYNTVINTVDSRKYIFLDDDSSLSKDYLNDIYKSSVYHSCIPIIKAADNIISPVSITGKVKLGKISSDTELHGIGSGLVLSRYIINEILKTKNNVFDERFFLYGVDTVFFKRLFNLKQNNHIFIIKGFEHDLSRLNAKSNTPHRIKERSYGFGLYCRYYPNKQNLYVLLILIIKTFYKKNKQHSLKHILAAIITGKHYRSNIN